MMAAYDSNTALLEISTQRLALSLTEQPSLVIQLLMRALNQHQTAHWKDLEKFGVRLRKLSAPVERLDAVD